VAPYCCRSQYIAIAFSPPPPTTNGQQSQAPLTVCSSQRTVGQLLLGIGQMQPYKINKDLKKDNTIM